MKKTSGPWLDKVIFSFLLSPMIVLGAIVASIVSKRSAFGYFAVRCVWWPANAYLIHKVCWAKGGVLLLRMVTFFFAHAAALAVVLLCFG
jgi:hypothetical protein